MDSEGIEEWGVMWIVLGREHCQGKGLVDALGKQLQDGAYPFASPDNLTLLSYPQARGKLQLSSVLRAAQSYPPVSCRPELLVCQ